jgi:hypothetical protein
MPKWKKPKDPEMWLALGDRCKIAKDTLSHDAYVAFLREQRELWHEVTGKPCKDFINMAQRIINFSQRPVIREFRGHLPWTGWGTLRQLTCLGDEKLRYLFETGEINRHFKRFHADVFRSMQKQGRIAPRHRGDK